MGWNVTSRSHRMEFKCGKKAGIGIVVQRGHHRDLTLEMKSDVVKAEIYK